MVTAERRAIVEIVVTKARVSQPALGAIWRALEAVPDPEIPAVSVVDLGIIRAVEWDAAVLDTLVVRLTPTYSGCPASDLIISGIREALAAVGVSHVRIDIQLAPPWTTDWMTSDAKRKLRDYGIAPPGGDGPVASAASRIDVAGISPLRRAGVIVGCPRCGSTRTQLVSQFGSTACKAHYRCVDCLEPFDYFKPH